MLGPLLKESALRLPNWDVEFEKKEAIYKALPVQSHFSEVKMTYLVPFSANLQVVAGRTAEYSLANHYRLHILASSLILQSIAEKVVTKA